MDLNLPQDDAVLPEPNNELIADDNDPQLANNDGRMRALNMLRNSLGERIPELDDVVLETEAWENLEHLCRSIERESWVLLNNNLAPVGKYNSHIRALALNIKDKNNGDFFRAILLGNVTPLEMAHLKPTDMASNEKKKKVDDANKKSLQSHVSEAETVKAILEKSKPIKKNHKGDFEIEKPPTDEACSHLTSEFVRAPLPESYLKQTVPLPKKLADSTSSKAVEKQMPKITSKKAPLSNSKKTNNFPASKVAHTSRDSFSNFDYQADDISFNVLPNRQNFTFNENLATSQFGPDYQPLNYTSMSYQQQPFYEQNVYSNNFNAMPNMGLAGFFVPPAVVPPSPEGPSFLVLKMRLKEIVAKYAEMRVNAKEASTNASLQPPSSPTDASSNADALQQLQTLEVKILSRCRMVHQVDNVESKGIDFDVLVNNMYGLLATKNIFQDKAWREHGGMVVKEHVAPDALMSHLDFCLKPDCPKEILNELAIVSIDLAKGVSASQSQAYEDLFNCLDASADLGLLSYRHPSKDNAYERRIYIYALNKRREMHSQLKTLLDSKLPPSGQRDNMLLGIIVLMKNR